MAVLGWDVDARGQTGLVEQARLRGVRELNTIYLDSNVTRSVHYVNALPSQCSVVLSQQ